MARDFWKQVDKTAACWLWRGSIMAQGYGHCSVRGFKRPVRAHRRAWEIENGPIPEGLFVLHRCDNRLCVRPSHLFLGTHEENMADMCSKGRQARGEGQHLAELTESDVLAIRASDLSSSALARRYGVTVPTIACVRQGVTWKHVGGRITLRKRQLTHEQAAEIRASTDKTRALAARYGVSTSTIENIKNGKTHQPVTLGWATGSSA